MSKKKSSSSSARTIAKALYDILANLSADALANPIITTAVAATGAAVGTVNPALLFILPFLGLGRWLNRRDSSDDENITKLLHTLIQGQTTELEHVLDKDFVQQFDAKFDHDRMLRRLKFLRRALDEVQTNQLATNDKIDRLADLLEDSSNDAAVLERILCDRFDFLCKKVDTLGQVANEIRAILKPVPALRIPVRDYQPNSQFGALHFSTCGVAFQGRKDAFATLHRFLEETDDKGASLPLSWLLLLAPGGAGKSRLALELCLKLEAGWRVGFLHENELSAYDAKKWAEWQPAEPTLIIVDYLHRYPVAVSSLISSLGTRSAPSQFPVRLLLLERDCPGDWTRSPWGEQFLRSGGQQLDLLQLASREMGCPVKPLQLSSLEDTDVWSILVDLLKQLHTPIPDRAETLARLRGIDADARPLFTVMLAYFLADKQSSDAKDWSKSTLLEFTIRRERGQWNAAGIDALHVNLLCLATVCGGVNRTFHLDPLEKLQGTGLFPTVATFNRRHYEFLSAQNAAEVLSPLTPDILGEYFLLVHLNAMDELMRARFIRTAWKANNYDFYRKTGIEWTLRRCLIDFGAAYPDKTILPGLFGTIPDDPLERLQWAAMVSNLQIQPGPIPRGVVDQLRRLVESDPRPELFRILAGALGNAVFSFASTRQFPQTTTLLEELRNLCVQQDSDEMRETLANALSCMITGLAEAGKIDHALASFSELVDIVDTNGTPKLRITLASGMHALVAPLCKSDRGDDATEILKRMEALSVETDIPEVALKLADAFFNAIGTMVSPDRVAWCLSRVRTLRLRNPLRGLQTRLGKGLVNAIYSLGRNGNVGAARGAMQELRDLCPQGDSQGTHELLGVGLVNLLHAFMVNDCFSEAGTCVQELRDLVAVDDRQLIRDRLCEGLYKLLRIRTAQSRFKDAIKVLEELRVVYQHDLRPEAIDCLAEEHHELYTKLMHAGYFDEASELLSELLILYYRNPQPENRKLLAEARYRTIAYLVNQERPDRILRPLAELRQLWKGDRRPNIQERLAQAHANVVLALCRLQMFIEADQTLLELEKLYSMNPSLPVMEVLGRAHFVLGGARNDNHEHALAQHHFQRVRTLACDCPLLLEFLHQHLPDLTQGV